LFFILLLIVVDRATGALLNYLYFRHEPVVGPSTTYVANYCNQELLVMGSSHAHHHYISNELADSTKLSCFNAGADGYYMLYSYAMLKCVLKRYTPKIILLDIRPDEFNIDPLNYDRLSILLPYNEQHPEIHSILVQRSNFENIKLLSKTYPFNSQIMSIINRNIYKNKNEFKATGELGFDALSDTVHIDKKIKQAEYYENRGIDSNYVNAYRSFIKDCLNRHIKLCIFISPVLPEIRIKIRSAQIASKIAATFHVPFFDYSNAGSFKTPVYFNDLEHLNINGARLFTGMVIKDIGVDSGQNSSKQRD